MTTSTDQLTRNVKCYPLNARHPHVLRLFNWFHDSSRIYLILEFAAKGELYKELQRHQRFDEQRTATVIIYIYFMLMLQIDK